jgi:putative ABC transport system permease protein
VLAAIAWQWRARRLDAAHGTAWRGDRTMTDRWWTDMRQTLRGLRRSPGYTLGAAAPVALAIALVTAVFAIVHAVLLRDLPFPRPDRLVIVGEHEAGASIGTLGYPTFLDVRDRATSFDGVAAMGGWGPTLTSPSTERLSGLRVTAGYFELLGVRPALGRLFEPRDDTPTTRRVVILSHDLWTRQFGADPRIVDTPIRLNEIEYRVIGVLPADFEPVVSATLYSKAEIWSPLGYEAGRGSACRSCRHLTAIASMRPGVSVETASAELAALHSGIAAQFPADYGRETMSADGLAALVARPMATPLAALFVAVLLVLAIAGANASSLATARAADQRPVDALRTVLGAGRGQIARLRAIEAALIAGAAGIAGLSGAQGILAWVIRNAPTGMPRVDHIGLNGAVLACAGAAVLVTAAVIAWLPIVQTMRVARSTGGASPRLTDDRRLVRAREGLVVIDVAIALMLAIGAGTMLRSVDRLLSVDPGFSAGNVHTVSLSLVGPRWAEDDSVRAFQRDLLEAVRATPGVEAAALAGQVPLGGNYDRRGGYLAERRTGRAEDEVEFERYSVTPGYLAQMGIPLKAGRDIAESDRADTERVMIVNESAARRYWPGQDPVGRRVVFGGSDAPWTVVGVAGDVRHYGLDVAPEPQMYMPQTQMTDSFLILTITTPRFDEVLPRVRDAVRRLGPDVPLYGVASMASLVDASAASRRFLAMLLGVFAVVAILMTSAGVYGLVAYTVARRTREFGIRLALGAPPSGIRRLVLSRGGLLTVVGAGLGLAAALPLTRLLGDQLFQTSPFDAGVVASGAAVLVATSALAHLVPAMRATRVSPTVALRGE